MCNNDESSNGQTKLLDSAIESYDSGAFREALALFLQLEKTRSSEFERPLLQSWIGACYYNLDEYNNAQPHLERCYLELKDASETKQVEHDLLEILYRLSIAHFEDSNFEKANEYFLLCKSKFDLFEEESFSDTRFNVLLFHGRLLRLLEKYEDSIEEFSLADRELKRFPKAPSAQQLHSLINLEMGNAWQDLKDFRCAYKYLSRVDPLLFEDALKSKYAYSLTLCLSWMNKFRKVISVFEKYEKYLRESELYATSLTLLGRAQYNRRDYQAARASFLRSIELHPSETWAVEGNQYYLGKLDALS